MDIRNSVSRTVGDETLFYFMVVLGLWLIVTGRVEAVIRSLTGSKDITGFTGVSGSASSDKFSGVEGSVTKEPSYPPSPAPRPSKQPMRGR